jgi:hypothetical protein
MVERVKRESRFTILFTFYRVKVWCRVAIPVGQAVANSLTEVTLPKASNTCSVA